MSSVINETMVKAAENLHLSDNADDDGYIDDYDSDDLIEPPFPIPLKSKTKSSSNAPQHAEAVSSAIPSSSGHTSNSTLVIGKRKRPLVHQDPVHPYIDKVEKKY